MSFPTPANEVDRLAALRALNIVDSAPEIAYDELAELAAQVCGCPVAYISFIDDDRRWLKARYGLPAEMVEHEIDSHIIFGHETGYLIHCTHSELCTSD